MSRSKTIGLDQNWMAQSDMRTLIEAQVIQNDPKRFKAAKAEAKKQAAALGEAFEPTTKKP